MVGFEHVCVCVASFFVFVSSFDSGNDEEKRGQPWVHSGTMMDLHI